MQYEDIPTASKLADYIKESTRFVCRDTEIMEVLYERADNEWVCEHFDTYPTRGQLAAILLNAKGGPAYPGQLTEVVESESESEAE